MRTLSSKCIIISIDVDALAFALDIAAFLAAMHVTNVFTHLLEKLWYWFSSLAVVIWTRQMRKFGFHLKV